MIARLEHLKMKLMRFFSRGTLMIRLFGLLKVEGEQESRGLILIQIDGLAREHMEAAMTEGRLPFLKSLVDRQLYKLRTHYSGLPSSTPAVQAELFYGVKNAVPAFSFFDRKNCTVFRMIAPDNALVVEEKLQSLGDGLLAGGSSYSNIYTGGADEAHFCASNMGMNNFFHKGNPFTVLMFFLLHIPSVIRTIILAVAEFFLAFIDMFRGLIAGANLWRELKFIPSRVGVTILARELVIAGISMDIARDRKVISCNFLGYDEQAHRRGPSSAFAYWGLKGIDNAVRRIWNIASKSPGRHYDIWIYSDHGQEDALPYRKLAGKSVHEAVAEIFSEKQEMQSFLPSERRGIQNKRSRYLGLGRAAAKKEDSECVIENPEGLVVTAMGPVGFIYLSEDQTVEERRVFAKRLVHEAKIPTVLIKGDDNKVSAFNSFGEWIIPENAPQIIGEDHPLLEEVARDLEELVKHPNAGEYVLSGWQPGSQPLTFPDENGSHAGPGTSETRGFVLLPGDAPICDPQKNWLRPLELRNCAMNFLKHEKKSAKRVAPDILEDRKKLRVMTYNVHSCKGMDGKISPERIARVIAQYSPDIVALQELDAGLSRTGWADQPQEIARSLAMDHHFHPPIAFEEGQYGDAVMSLLPLTLVKAANLKTPGCFVGERRGAIWGRFFLGDTWINIINTHLGFRKEARTCQLKALLGKDWLDNPDCRGPLILCGDFNLLPSSRTYSILTERFHEAQEKFESKKTQNTYSSRYPLGRIDYIFFSSHFEVKDIMVPKNHLAMVASDHSPVIADLELVS